MTVATISQTNAETQELDLFQQETVSFTSRVDQWSLDWLDQMVPEFCVDCVTQAWNLAWDSEILGPRCPAWSCCPQHCLACQWEHPVSRNHIWERNWFIFSRDYTPSYPSSSRTLVIDQRSTSNKYKNFAGKCYHLQDCFEQSLEVDLGQLDHDEDQMLNPNTTRLQSHVTIVQILSIYIYQIEFQQMLTIHGEVEILWTVEIMVTTL